MSETPARDPASGLEERLREGHFVVTAELGPPRSGDAGVVREKAELLRGCVDAVNVTDNQSAVVRMSSLAVCRILVEQGLEPVLQMTCRDRNRIAIQSDLLGAQALGIHNVLCLTGDHMSSGNHPQARKVFDLDSVNLIAMVRGLDGGHFECGEEVKPAPRFFVGAVENPFAPPLDFRPFRLRKKADAGAQFIQTQMIFDVGRFREFMAACCDLGLDRRLYLLAGVGPLKSPGMARAMRDRLPGCRVPDGVVRRMEGTPRERWREEGIRICVETIEQVKDIPGVAGIHIMSIEWEEAVAAIVEQARLVPRPGTGELSIDNVASVPSAER